MRTTLNDKIISEKLSSSEGEATEINVEFKKITTQFFIEFPSRISIQLHTLALNGSTPIVTREAER